MRSTVALSDSYSERLEPTRKQIYLICDNDATHIHPRVQRRIEMHGRFHVRFTPTSVSWLNRIERFSRNLTTNQIRQGVFQDLEQLITAIGDSIDHHNDNPMPSNWIAKASDILEKVSRARATLINDHLRGRLDESLELGLEMRASMNRFEAE